MPTRVFDGDRYRALIVVVGAVFGVLVAIDLVLRAAFGTMPDLLVRASFRDPNLHDWAARRVSAILARRDQGDHPLAVIVGASSSRDGFIPALLEGADPGRHRWLNLATAGASFDELRYQFGPLFASGLRADLVVLAVHSGWLAGHTFIDPAFEGLEVAPGTPRRSWLLFHHGWLNHLARIELASVRERLLLRLGVGFDAIYPPVADPWRTPTREPLRVFDARDDNQMQVWKATGWFEPASFGRVDGAIADAAAVIAGCQRVGQRVVIVLMPESSPLRAARPPEADAAFRRALARVPHPPQVLDLRAAIVDPLFRDFIHLNEPGAAQLSTLLPARIAAEH